MTPIRRGRLRMSPGESLDGYHGASNSVPFSRLGHLTFHLAHGGRGWISHREGFVSRAALIWP